MRCRVEGGQRRTHDTIVISGGRPLGKQMLQGNIAAPSTASVPFHYGARVLSSAFDDRDMLCIMKSYAGSVGDSSLRTIISQQRYCGFAVAVDPSAFLCQR